MSNLNAFLHPAQTTEVCEIIVSRRFLDADGRPVPFKVRPLTQEEMAWYAGTPEPYDKAGAYGVQGLGALLVREIQGDYYTVMGLPVSRLWRELAAFAPGKLPLRGFLA